MPFLSQPSMVLNDSRMQRDKFPMMQMWNSWLVPATAGPSAVFGHINNVIASAPGRFLKNLIFHGHGDSGGVNIGSLRIGVNCESHFKRLGGKVEHIWFVSCQTASNVQIDCVTSRQAEHRVASDRRLRQEARNAGLTARSFVRQRVFSGSYFCRMVAVAANCNVTASYDIQYGGPEIANSGFLPYGVIESFEGVVMTWSPSGVPGAPQFYAGPR